MTSEFDPLSSNFKMTRQQRLAELKDGRCWDMIIIGGGITGAGILKLASKLKLKVLLLEQKDFAWGSSSRSSKMVHGGLRYMAQGQVKLTVESVRERQKLLKEAQDLVTDHSFVMSHYQREFPWPWLFNALLAAYDVFAGIKKRKFWSKLKYLSLVPKAKEQDLLGGSQFSDALTEDARLVQRLIQEAKLLGAQAVNYVRVLDLLTTGEQVTGVKVQAAENAQTFTINAKVVVNATGAWSDALLPTTADKTALPFKMRPLRGSHIILPSWRLPVASVIAVLHPKDKRPVQIYPWQNVTVVGTTDVEHHQDLNFEPQISVQEFDYLMQCITHQFPSMKISVDDVISSYSGVRPVIASGGIISPSKEKREHGIWQSPGLITVAGGKLTTFKLIAQQVLHKVQSDFGFDNELLSQPIFEQGKAKDYLASARLPRHIQKQINACYGALSQVFTEQNRELCQTISYSRHLWGELLWAVKYEQVVHLDDLLLRRTRLGNVLPEGGLDYLSEIKALCAEFLPWDEARWQLESNRYKKLWQESYSCPGKDMPQTAMPDPALVIPQ
ncbi:glycerol-3-phosphate dehydrogenase/oxidase [Thalassomonas sp. RHCl1]|uniref:glycerol-3-phosphate dehydrogenase/oxidase n=1 Tax=Thalassomonas sp. RHCl1 TaxID=2995320 RepID=UPI00248D3A93|nr:glycerol-3-phosphate dehydrogenase/oxidase [Thalassomonas sp. RHCl1]